MNMGLGLQQKLGLHMKQSPQQVLLSSLIQLPMISLEQRIRLELEQNPFLEEELDFEEEVIQEQTESTSEFENESGEIDHEISMDDKENSEVDWDTILNDENNFQIKSPRDDSAEIYDRPERYETTLPDHLLSQLHLTNFNEVEVLVGECIIWNINENGYLPITLEDIATVTNVPLAVVQNVLQTIQRFEPVGIAARDLQECLLVQLMEMENPDEKAIKILREYFDEFKNMRFEKIMKQLEITLEELNDVVDIITRLNPKPGDGYITVNDGYVIPELIVIREDGEFKISMNDWNVPHLRVNNSYKKLFLDKKTASIETKQFIKQRLESARWLINSIHQRRITILNVMEAIIDKQYDFFDKGKEYIRPMILKDIADEIHMDISTISRVTSGKYVQTEHGVFELKYFFSEKIKCDDGDNVSNKTIKNRIKNIIGAENHKRPLNDQSIAEMLKLDGFNVARRTVAKYREQMMIPVSRLRRKL
ncbi:RNA polymerase factor sigma-54 [candidate division KSB1 bacterium]|nr:RNA polymerase factor sigma-54 [candidate division KSB1 bacterium]